VSNLVAQAATVEAWRSRLWKKY